MVLFFFFASSSSLPPSPLPLAGLSVLLLLFMRCVLKGLAPVCAREVREGKGEFSAGGKKLDAVRSLFHLDVVWDGVDFQTFGGIGERGEEN